MEKPLKDVSKETKNKYNVAMDPPVLRLTSQTSQK